MIFRKLAESADAREAVGQPQGRKIQPYTHIF